MEGFMEGGDLVTVMKGMKDAVGGNHVDEKDVATAQLGEGGSEAGGEGGDARRFRATGDTDELGGVQQVARLEIYRETIANGVVIRVQGILGSAEWRMGSGEFLLIFGRGLAIGGLGWWFGSEGFEI